MASGVCNAIKTVDNFIVVKEEESRININFNQTLNYFCPYKEHYRKNECHSYNEMVSSAFIYLLNLFNIGNYNEDGLKIDKLVKYAILWLSYKLNQNPQSGIKTLNDFYTKHIQTNTKYTNIIDGVDTYKSYKDYIDKNNELMAINIKDIYKFYDALKSLCELYTVCNGKNKDSKNCLEAAKELGKIFGKLNDDFDIIEDSPYYKILSTLSTDYYNFKNKCNDSNCKDIPTLPPIKPTKSSAQDSVESSDVTSSSSIASKSISVLLIFAAIPISLGIAYKYSLFGFDKRLQRQYLREKVKKLKKKMEHYI
ncbi:CIR protein [Plasmodium chabaudi adami]|uniref:CIR protein n=1 Tax=Plasmodium chabaudi adami TaxID=5826 RepID=A0A1D3LAB4_PLACE|nr:CIR protein [Plasmodium chabaudi adami]